MAEAEPLHQFTVPVRIMTAGDPRLEREIVFHGQARDQVELLKHQTEQIAPQFEQALANVLAVLAEAGGEPQHICRITAYCCSKSAYLAARSELGAIWRRLMGRHYPAMSMIFVSDLLDSPGQIELEATAVLPATSRSA